jgi:secreted protein with Ig-like and vWFA domain
LANFAKLLVDVPLESGSLPDVDSALLSLTGFSQGAYALKKAFTSDPSVKILSITPGEGASAGDKFVISGTGFGGNAGIVKFNDDRISVLAWYEGAITAVIPASFHAGQGTVAVLTVDNHIATKEYKIVVPQQAVPKINN